MGQSSVVPILIEKRGQIMLKFEGFDRFEGSLGQLDPVKKSYGRRPEGTSTLASRASRKRERLKDAPLRVMRHEQGVQHRSFAEPDASKAEPQCGLFKSLFVEVAGKNS